MTTRLLPIIFVMSMVAASATAFPQDKHQKFELFGSAMAGGMGSGQTSRDRAKMNEYRDLSDGGFGGFDLRGRGKRFYLDGFAENLGRDDMYFNFQGGMYGELSFNLFGDWLTHNFGFGPHGARSPYLDPGSSNLRLFSINPSALADVNVPPWSSFKYAADRREVGGSFEFSHKTPWYFLVEASELNQSGINKADAAALGTSPGNGFVDLPYPVDYNTHNIFFEGGYQKPRGHIALNYMDSHFSNDNELLFFQNPFFGFGTDTATFAPDNDYVRIALNGMLRQLRWDSTLSARLTYDRGTDNYQMITAVLNTADSPVLTPTNPNVPTFNGKVENATAHVSIASFPATRLDTRVYYNFYKRNNSSTDVVFQVLNPGLACTEEGPAGESLSVFCTGTRYGYTRHNPGIEAGYRLTTGNRLSTGFDYERTRRNRFDSDETRENRVFAQWNNTSFSAFTARVRYQFIYRSSDFLTGNAGFNANSPFFLERFVRSFDVANLRQHIVKAYFDWATPIKFLDLGFEAYYKRNNYRDLILGRLKDSRKEIYGSVSYGDPAKFRVTLFGDVEFINYDSFHRTINASPCPPASPNCFDPRTPPTPVAFNWAAQLKDKNWTIELGVDWPLKERLALSLSGLIQDTQGNVDFQTEVLDTGQPAALLFPITAYDNTKKRAIWPRAVYRLRRNVELTVGYSFETYAYSDDQLNGYQYTIGGGATRSYLSGIYAFPDYDLHVGYARVRYIFDRN